MPIEKGLNMPSGEEGWRRELEARRQELETADQELLKDGGKADLGIHNEHWKLFNKIITLDTFLDPRNSGLSRGELREKVHSEMGTSFIGDVFEEEMDGIEKMKNAV